MKSIKFKLTLLFFLQFGVWGAYLTSMGSFLAGAGLGSRIGLFYAVQGLVSLFMPALIGIMADKLIQGQRLLGYCHLLAAAFMFAAGYYAITSGDQMRFAPLFTLYTFSVAFYMPTIALSNSVAYNALQKAELDTVSAFPPIRVFGTIGFIISMWCCDLLGYQQNANQFIQCAVLGLLLGLYSFSMPECPVSKGGESKSFAQILGLDAFRLFSQKQMALFFIFSMLLGVSLQITNGFANPFISDFSKIPEYADTFGVNHANILISLSQISETLCILLIPFCMKRFGIKNVMLIAMFAWVLRFGFFGIGNPGEGVWLLILSMIVYGVAFDFFNISGSLFVDKNVPKEIRSSAQGLFMIMTNGVGATAGTLCAQAVINHFVFNGSDGWELMNGWSHSWLLFAAYSLVVAVSFMLLFKTEKAR